MPLRNRVTLVWGVVMVAIGVAILARTFAGGGLGITWGLIAGLMFIAVGVGRAWLARRDF